MLTPSHPPIQRAFVLGAGLGTRLKRLTECRPKPLVPICAKPLITYAFDHLLDVGVTELIINTHHRAEVYETVFPDASYRGIPLQFRHEPVLLETGGGIKNIEDLAGDAPLIVHNGDVLSTLPLAPAVNYHLASGNEVTLILRSHGGPLHVAFDITGETPYPTGPLSDIRHTLGKAPGTHLFTGIYIISPAFFRRLTTAISSVTPYFLEMIRQGQPPGAIVIDDGLWWDLGTREQILAAHQHHQTNGPWIDPTATVAFTASITGASAIGPNCAVEEGARLHDTILWNGVTVKRGSCLTRCIVTDHQTIEGTYTDCDV